MNRVRPDGRQRTTRFDASTERWSPARWTSEHGRALVDAIDDLSGATPDRRAFHASGVVHRGRFVGTGQASRFSDFVPFGAEVTSDALVRFSPILGDLDDRGRRPQRGLLGMAVKVVPTLPESDDGGETSDFVAMTADVFPVWTSTQFLNLLRALRHPLARRAVAVAWLLVSRQASLPALWRTLRAMGTRHPTVFDAEYHGVQTFWLVRSSERDRGIDVTPMRYRWVPLPHSPARGTASRSFLLQLNIADESVDEGALADPTRPWPDHEVVVAGRLDLTEELADDDQDLAFNPVVLAPGIEPGDDDLFAGRRGAYAVSHVRRSPHARARASGGGAR